jgi:hypothetical protein
MVRILAVVWPFNLKATLTSAVVFLRINICIHYQRIMSNCIFFTAQVSILVVEVRCSVLIPLSAISTASKTVHLVKMSSILSHYAFKIQLLSNLNHRTPTLPTAHRVLLFFLQECRSYLVNERNSRDYHRRASHALRIHTAFRTPPLLATGHLVCAAPLARIAMELGSLRFQDSGVGWCLPLQMF